MANPKVLKKKEIEQHELNSETIKVRGSNEEIIIIDYNDIIEMNNVDVKELDEVLNIYMMRRIIHVSALNALIMSVLTSGYHPYTLSLLTNYYMLFIEIYTNKNCLEYDVDFTIAMNELKIDDYISRLPYFSPYTRTIGSTWLDVETMVSVLSVAIQKRVFNKDVFHTAIENCVDYNFKKAAVAMDISASSLNVIKLGGER